MAIISDLHAADTVFDLPSTMYEYGSDGESLIFPVTNQCVMVASCNHPEVPVKNDGTVDWLLVSRLRVEEIEYVH